MTLLVAPGLAAPIEAGSRDFRRISIALFAAGMATFSLLYATQALLPALVDAFAVSPSQASLTVSVATGALALAVLPLATLSEAVGRRRTMIAALVIATAVGLVIPWAPSFGALLALRALQGAALAGLPATRWPTSARRCRPAPWRGPWASTSPATASAG